MSALHDTLRSIVGSDGIVEQKKDRISVEIQVEHRERRVTAVRIEIYPAKKTYVCRYIGRTFTRLWDYAHAFKVLTDVLHYLGNDFTEDRTS